MAFVLCFHLIPLFLLWAWTIFLRNSRDANLTVFIGMWIWRNSRLFINMWFFMRYQPAYPAKVPTVYPKDVTVIIPTVFDLKTYTSDLRECITTCLLNYPAKIIIVTNKENAATLHRLVTDIRHGDGTSYDVPIEIKTCAVCNKREQLAVGIGLVRTDLILFLDDHVFLKPRFLETVVCAFEDPRVGLCGTKKTVRRQVPEADSLWGCYWESFWNVMGALYLTRHNFEIRATNAADGGVFVVSGRALLVRTTIVNSTVFLDGYKNEHFFFGLIGPLASDDDNFVTRWATQLSWNIKIQYTEEATVETTLGQPDKFVGQCLRWARTTFRSNLCSLLTQRTVWYRQPLTVWTTFIPSLLNLALFWDFGMVFVLTKSTFYLQSSCRQELLFSLWLWIYFAKSVKLMGYFYHHPQDFVLFFFPIPAYHLFAWFHSFIKLYAAATFYNTSWTGRKPNFRITKEGQGCAER
ncbi:nucleotide-diphospho-sugar transferase [Nemania serpens]|nr:nucleotide-diphospho-sugar transferase [Nemania serpens]